MPEWYYDKTMPPPHVSRRPFYEYDFLDSVCSPEPEQRESQQQIGDTNSMNLEAKVFQFTNAKLYEQGYRFVSVRFSNNKHDKTYTYVAHPDLGKIKEDYYCLVETENGVRTVHVVEVLEFPNLDNHYKPIFAVIPNEQRTTWQDEYENTVNEVKHAMRRRLFRNVLKELDDTTPVIDCTPEVVVDDASSAET